MGYWTALQVQVFDCPADQAEAALDVVLRHAGAELQPDIAAEVHLDLTHTYEDGDSALGTVFDVASELEAEAPGASFAAWQDPSDSGEGPILGWVIIRTPGLGVFQASSDAYGQAHISRAELLTALDAARAADQPAEAAAKAALGGPWS